MKIYTNEPTAMSLKSNFFYESETISVKQELMLKFAEDKILFLRNKTLQP